MEYSKGLYEEDVPFLVDAETNSDSSSNPITISNRRRWLWPVIHLSLILTYSIVFVLLVLNLKAVQPTALYPIKNLNVTYTAEAYTDFEISPYAGPPSPEIDAMWHQLLEKTTLRVSEEELSESNQSSVKLPGGGYMAWFGAYHQLHCIKMLRQWNYREHYHPNVTEDDRPHWDIHADHCLDILRSAAMCHADTTLTTFGWADLPKPMLNTRPIEHRCVDWDALMRSIDSRLVSHSEMDLMVNPNTASKEEKL